MVTNYFERPCRRTRRVVGCGSRTAGRSCPPEDFPVQDVDGTFLDEPPLHRLRYKHDPESPTMTSG
jgi:hypothetical protein